MGDEYKHMGAPLSDETIHKLMGTPNNEAIARAIVAELTPLLADVIRAERQRLAGIMRLAAMSAECGSPWDAFRRAAQEIEADDGPAEDDTEPPPAEDDATERNAPCPNPSGCIGTIGHAGKCFPPVTP